MPNFPVDPGDSISCLLTVLTRHRVLLNITNYSYNPPHFAAVKIDAPSITLPNGNKVQLSVSGATAEWIMERPMIPPTTDLAPFADYDCIDFVNCRAFEGSPQDSVLRLQNPKSPRFIRMYDIYQNPPRTRYISMPERIDDSSFRVTYGDFSN